MSQAPQQGRAVPQAQVNSGTTARHREGLGPAGIVLLVVIGLVEVALVLGLINRSIPAVRYLLDDLDSLRQGGYLLIGWAAVVLWHGIGLAARRALRGTWGLVALLGALCLPVAALQHDAWRLIEHLLDVDTGPVFDFIQYRVLRLLIPAVGVALLAVAFARWCRRNRNVGRVMGTAGLILAGVSCVILPLIWWAVLGPMSQGDPGQMRLRAISQITLNGISGVLQGVIVLLLLLAWTAVPRARPPAGSGSATVGGRLSPPRVLWIVLVVATLGIGLVFSLVAVVIGVVRATPQIEYLLEAPPEAFMEGDPFAHFVIERVNPLVWICFYLSESLGLLVVGLVEGIRALGRSPNPDRLWRAGLFAILGGLFHAVLVGLPAIIAGIIGVRSANRAARAGEATSPPTP